MMSIKTDLTPQDANLMIGVVKSMSKPKRPYADPTSKRRSVTVNDENWRALKAIGQGNASEGIRRLLRERER